MVKIVESIDGCKIIPTSSAKRLPEDLLDILLMNLDCTVSAYDADIPTPWDAEFNVDNGNLVISGSAGPNGVGSCKISVPVSSGLYYVSCPNDLKRSKYEGMLNKLGWEVK